MEALKAEVRGINIDELYEKAKTPIKGDFREIELGKYKEK